MKRLFFYSALLFCALNVVSCDVEDPVTPEITVGEGNSKTLEFSSDAQDVFINIDANSSVVWNVEVAAINDGDDIAWLSDAIINNKVTAGIGLSFRLPQNDLFTYNKVVDDYGDFTEEFIYHERSAKLIFSTSDKSAKSVEITITQKEYTPATLAITIPVKNFMTGEIEDTEYAVKASEISDTASPVMCTLSLTGDEQTFEIPVKTNDKNWTADVVAGTNKDISRVSIAPSKGANGDVLKITLAANNDSSNYTGFDVVIKAQEATIKMAISQAPIPKMPTECIVWGGANEYGDDGMEILEDNAEIKFSSNFDNVTNFMTVLWKVKINGAGGDLILKCYNEDGTLIEEPLGLYDGYFASEANGDYFGFEKGGSGESYTFSTKPFFENKTSESRSMKLELYYVCEDEEQKLFTTTVIQEAMPDPIAATEITVTQKYMSTDGSWEWIFNNCTEGYELDLSDSSICENDQYTIEDNGFGGEVICKAFDAEGNELTTDYNGNVIDYEWANIYANFGGIDISTTENNTTGVKRSLTVKFFYAINGTIATDALLSFNIFQGAEVIPTTGPGMGM